MTDDPEAIAARLTKAQRDAIIREQGTAWTLHKVMVIRPALFGRVDYHNGYGFLQMPTAFCLRVRESLQNEPGT